MMRNRYQLPPTLADLLIVAAAALLVTFAIHGLGL